MSDEPVVIYGTSITQGGCASRPGMAYTNILSRYFNTEVINLGFSGNGKGEPEVIKTISEISSPKALILDYEANSMDIVKLKETLPVAVEILRARHPSTPIIVISRISFASDLVQAHPKEQRKQSNAFQLELVREKRKAGDENIHFINGEDLLGSDFDECTVDGVHPTDWGFMRMAKALEPQLAGILKLGQ